MTSSNLLSALRPHQLLLAATLLALPSLAQGAPTSTSPRGFMTTAGNDFIPLASVAGGALIATLTQVDGTQIGHPQTIKNMWMRQGLDLVQNQSSQTIKYTIRCGHADWAQAKAGTLLLVGNWTTVVDPRTEGQIWSKKPNKPLAPWEWKIGFDRPFQFDGQNALVFQISVLAGSTGAVDGLDASRTVVIGTSYGSGCSFNGKAIATMAELVTERSGAMSTLKVRTAPQIGASPMSTLVLIGVKPAKVSLPWCADLLTSAEVTESMDSTEPGEYTRSMNFPHSSALVGVSLFVQSWSMDGNGMIYGSNGWDTGPYAKPPTQDIDVAWGLGFGPPFTNFVNPRSVKQSRFGAANGAGIIVGFD